MAGVGTPRPRDKSRLCWEEGQVWMLPTRVSRPVCEAQTEGRGGSAGWSRRMLLSFRQSSKEAEKLKFTAWLSRPYLRVC